MLQLNIMGTGKSIQQDARNKLALLPHTSVTLILVVVFMLYLIAPKDYLALQSFDSGTNEGYSKNTSCPLN
jgi:hypothetical protein